MLREIIREIYFQNLFFKDQSHIFMEKNFHGELYIGIFYKSDMLSKISEKFIFMSDTGILSCVKGMKRQEKNSLKYSHAKSRV